jgi:hypothetical protein
MQTISPLYGNPRVVGCRVGEVYDSRLEDAEGISDDEESVNPEVRKRLSHEDDEMWRTV